LSSAGVAWSGLASGGLQAADHFEEVLLGCCKRPSTTHVCSGDSKRGLQLHGCWCGCASGGVLARVGSSVVGRSFHVSGGSVGRVRAPELFIGWAPWTLSCASSQAQNVIAAGTSEMSRLRRQGNLSKPVPFGNSIYPSHANGGGLARWHIAPRGVKLSYLVSLRHPFSATCRLSHSLLFD
jgi:hypothetical protein